MTHVTDMTVVNPATGEVVDLDTAPTTDLASGLQDLEALLTRLGDFRQLVIDTLAGRMDTANSRTERVGEFILETNAPTVEDCPVGPLREVLDRLVADGVLDGSVVDRVITTPPPKFPEPRVAKRELNKLKGHADERVTDAISEVVERRPQRRTLKIKRVEDA
ncbi:MAG TPA: hypothetical protein VFT50_11580 [Baekduia sp.]|nr:hypothetical protein [Baekduia sp.]